MPTRGTATVYPLDFDALEKGSWIEARQIESWPDRDGRPQFIGREERAYSFRMLRVKDEIEKRTGIRCRADGERLRLMTDAEHLEYQGRESDRYVRGYRRNTRWLQEIDSRNLNDIEKKKHEYQLRHQTGVAVVLVQEQRKAARNLRLIERGSEVAALARGKLE
jgi:hypothetical protein